MADQKKQNEKRPEKELSREERIEQLATQMAQAQEAINVFREQYEQSKMDLKGSDEAQNEQIAQILNRLPEGATPKGVLDDILQAATPKRTQILNNISKLSASVKIEQMNHSRMQNEKSAIEKSIREERLTEQAKELADLFTEFETGWIAVERLFLNLKNLGLSISVDDPDFSSRIQKAGNYPSYYTQVLSALFNPGRLPSLSIPFLIENISNYSESPLAQGDRSIRRSEEKHVFLDKKPQDKMWRGKIPENEEEY